MTIHRSYRELIRIPTFEERYNYLKLTGVVGGATFGFDRHLNQMLYRSNRWRTLRNQIIVRDNGCDLACEGYEINDQIVIHHINPLSAEDIENGSDLVFDPNGLVCTSHRTHMAIHYGDSRQLPQPLVERRPGDTTLWR
jgi:hypothetical protein